MKIIYCLIFLLTGGVALAQQPVSLSDAMNLAVRNSATAKNARLDVLIQQAKNQEITGSIYPQINGRGEYDYYLALPKQYISGESFPGLNKDTVLELVFGQKNTTVANITATQVLFNGSLLVALQARKAVMELASTNARLTEEGVRYNVQRAYYALAVAQRQFGILATTLGTARQMAHEMDVLYTTGYAEKIEVDRANVQVNNLATDSLRTANVLTVSEQMLKYLMGMDIQTEIVLTDTALDAILTNATNTLAEDFNYNDRTDFSLLNQQLRLNEYDLKRHKYSGLPSLNGIANAGYNYASNEFSKLFDRFPYNSYVGLQIVVPVFDGTQRRKRVKQAELTVEKTKNSIADLQLYIDAQVSQSRNTLKNALLAMQSQERNLLLANSVLDLARKKYKAGVGSNLEVNQAQTDVFQAQNNYFQAMLEAFNAQSDLQRSLGDFK